MNYLSLYQSNKLSIIKPDDFSYNQLKLEYNNISENKLVKIGKIVFSKIQTNWLNYRELYRLYREAGTKEERREIKKKIVKENSKRHE